jgi:hypothetical protein
VSTTANFRNITIGVPLGQCATASRTLISNLSCAFGIPVSPHAVSSLVKGNDELSAWLLDKCIAYAKAHAHPERPDHTVWEVFEEERPKLVAYRGRFDGFHNAKRQANAAPLDVDLSRRGDLPERRTGCACGSISGRSHAPKADFPSAPA